MNLERIFKDKRGQARTIDFTMSFFLFLIIVTQMVFIMFDSSTLIKSENDTTDITTFTNSQANLILGNSGSLANGNDWGTFLSTDNLTTFGLHSNYPAAKQREIDPMKLLRIVPNVEHYFNDSYILTYDEVREINQLSSDQDFTLSVRTPLNVSLEIVGSTLNARVTYLNEVPISGANVSFFYYDSNDTWNTLRTITNATGIGTVNTGAIIQIAIAVGWNEYLWGISFRDDGVNFSRDQNIPIFIEHANNTHVRFYTNSTYTSESQIEVLSAVTQRTANTNETVSLTNSPLWPLTIMNSTLWSTIATGVTVAVVVDTANNNYNLQTTPALLDDLINPVFGEIPTNAEEIVETYLSLCRGVYVLVEYVYSEN